MSDGSPGGWLESGWRSPMARWRFGLAVLLGFSGAAFAQAAHEVRATLAFSAAPVDAESPATGWHVGYLGHIPIAPSWTADVLLSAVPRSFTSIVDNSSFFSVRYRPEGWRPAEGWSLTLFPFSSARYRVGAEPLLAVARAPYQRNPAPASVALAGLLRFERGPWLVEAGLKTGLLVDMVSLEDRRYFAPFSRLRWVGPARLRFDVAAAFVPQGPNPAIAPLGRRVEEWTAAVAPRVLWSWGQAPAPIRVASRESKAVEFFELLAEPLPLDGGTGVDVELEGIASAQRLEEFASSEFNPVRIQRGEGAKLRATFQHRTTRAQLFALYRNVALIQADANGFPPHRAFPADATLTAEVRVEGAVDHALRVGDAVIRPGVLAEMLLPGSFTSNEPLVGTGDRTQVVNDANVFSLLPRGDSALATFRLAGTAAVELTRHLRANLEVGYRYDPNRTSIGWDTGVLEPAYETPNTVTYFLYLQGRL